MQHVRHCLCCEALGSLCAYGGVDVARGCAVSMNAGAHAGEYFSVPMTTPDA